MQEYLILAGGKRQGRKYKTKNGLIIHADINGAANILRKANVVPEASLYEQGIEGMQSPRCYSFSIYK